MGYLVYCPTCGAKMSSNALACPVCGENDFFRREKTVCTCPTCNGARTLRVCERMPVIVSNRGIEKWPPEGSGFLWDLDTDHERSRPYWEDAPSLAHAQCAAGLKSCHRLSDMDYRHTISTGYTHWFDFNFHEITCPRCKGTGYTYEGPVDVIDIRKKV